MAQAVTSRTIRDNDALRKPIFNLLDAGESAIVERDADTELKLAWIACRAARKERSRRDSCSWCVEDRSVEDVVSLGEEIDTQTFTEVDAFRSPKIEP
jgi:hypothetical protein